MGVIHLGPVEKESEITKVGRHVDLLLPLDELFALPTVGDQIADRADLKVMLLFELQKIGEPCHRAIGIKNFTNDARGIESGKSGKINSCLGVTGAPEDSSQGGLQGKDMARLAEILCGGLGVAEHLDGRCPVARTDARGGAVRGIDGDSEVG